MVTIPRVHGVEPIIDGKHDVGLVGIASHGEGVGDGPTEELDSCPDVLGLVAMAVKVRCSPVNKLLFNIKERNLSYLIL